MIASDINANTRRKPCTGKALPRPPFGNLIIDLIRRGEKPNVFITAGGDAWHRHQFRRERIVLPPNTDPASFDWSFMRGLAPTIIGDDAPVTTLRKLAWCLLRAGCPLVCLLYKDVQCDNVVRCLFFRHPHA